MSPVLEFGCTVTMGGKPSEVACVTGAAVSAWFSWDTVSDPSPGPGREREQPVEGPRGTGMRASSPQLNPPCE